MRSKTSEKVLARSEPMMFGPQSGYFIPHADFCLLLDMIDELEVRRGLARVDTEGGRGR